MMKLNIDVIASESDKLLRRHIRDHWDCDWITLDLLAKAAPVYDADMWRIYAAEYRKDVKFLTEEDCRELANLNRDAIDTFVWANTLKRISDIVQRWKTFANIANDTFLGMNIPSGAYLAFKNFVGNYRNDNYGDNAVVRESAFQQFRSELLVNGVTYEDAEGRRALSIEEFRLFINAIEGEFNALTQNASGAVMDRKRKLQQIVDLTKMILLVCIGTQDNRNDTYTISLFDGLFRWRGTGHSASIQRNVAGFGYLSMGHAVCLYADSPVELPEGVHNPDTNSNAYRFLVTTLFQQYLLKKDASDSR